MLVLDSAAILEGIVMQPFPWSSEFEIGHSVIDAQHRELFRLANSVHAMIGQGDRKEIERGIKELIAYTRVHFRTEEGLLKVRLYPDLAEHRKTHQALTQRAQELWNRRDSVTAEELLETLSEWIVNHIKGTDQDFRGKI
jgi:hemerythrin